MSAARRGGLIAALVLALLLPATVRAEGEGDEARRLFEEGVAALGREDYATALVAFQRARELSPRAVLLFNIGMCHRALMQYPQAIAAFREYVGESAGDPNAADLRRQAAQLVDEMDAGISDVEVLVNVDGATLYLDGAQVGSTPLVRALRVGPGSHVVEARREGYRDARMPFDVMAGEDTQVQLELEALPAVIAPPVGEADDGGVVDKWWFWTILGVVVAGGAVTAGVLLWPEDEPPSADWILHGL
jgi:tetratricopeptide (TPR) repeat protein